MDPWNYDPARDLEKPMIERLRHFPREPDILVYGLRLSAAFLVRFWLRLYHRLSIRGLENLPAEGSFVMVANHSSHLDVLCLLAALPWSRLHRTFPAAAQDYFFVNAPRVFLAARTFSTPLSRYSSCSRIISLTSELFPDPLTPVTQTNRPSGISTSTSARNCHMPRCGSM